MGRLFCCIVIFSLLSILLFLPIIFETDIHFDLNRKKFAFLVLLYGKIKVLGGYADTYPGGVALHVSKEKAILLPYNDIENERKRFSFVKTFKPIAFSLSTESGAEYLLYTMATHAALRAYFYYKNGKKEEIENNLWVTDGEVLRVTLRSVIFFNGYILCCNIIQFLKEKWREYARKR